MFWCLEQIGEEIVDADEDDDIHIDRINEEVDISFKGANDDSLLFDG